MTSDSFQYRALFEYKRERGDDISLQPGDVLTVPKASLMAVPGLDYQDGDERSPKGWLHGTNERTKEKGDFPGTFVEYVGVLRAGPPAAKSWPRPVPPTPGCLQTTGGAQPPAAAASGECCTNRIQHMWMFVLCFYRNLWSVCAVKSDVGLQVVLTRAAQPAGAVCSKNIWSTDPERSAGRLSRLKLI